MVSVKYLTRLPFQLIRGCNEKFPDWPPGTRNVNGTRCTLFCESVWWVLPSWPFVLLCNQ